MEWWPNALSFRPPLLAGSGPAPVGL